MSTTIEVAVLGPNDHSAPNGMYVRRTADFLFNRLNGSITASQSHLKARGAQFHKLAVPDWVSGTDRGLVKLKTLSSALKDDCYNAWADDVDDAIRLIKEDAK